MPDRHAQRTVFRPQRTNTGPKGVREDARRHYAMQKLMQQAEKARQQEELRRAAWASVNAQEYTEEADKDSSSEDDDDDDEEFQRYKLERLKQMQKVTSERAHMPTFGQLEKITLDQFLAAVDGTGWCASDCATVSPPLPGPSVGSPRRFCCRHAENALAPCCVCTHTAASSPMEVQRPRIAHILTPRAPCAATTRLSWCSSKRSTSRAASTSHMRSATSPKSTTRSDS